MLKISSCFDSIENYLEFYDLKVAAAKHEFTPFKSNGFELAGHIFIPLETGRLQRPSPSGVSLTGFRPADYKATVIILHGWLNHVGLLSKLIKHLTGAGFAVATYDLPGHGLSSGQPTAIDDFSQYRDSLNDFMKIIKPQLHGPYHAIGHSTGAAIVMDYLFTGREKHFDKVILIAPLVRSQLWFLSKLGCKIYRLFAKNIFRFFRNVSSDKDFLRFVRYKDPLQAKKVSLNWVNAMFKWNQKIVDANIINRLVAVIQGTNDNIVSWKYNLEFIQSKFSRAEIKFIENARHELFNESAGIRKEVFSQISSYLEN
jgi:alpha-beta hydrolase superfamily lysophospholipase